MMRAALSITLLLLAPLAGARADYAIGVTGDHITVVGNDIQGAGGATWTPLDLGASLMLWLDASDIETIALSNNYVTAWTDKSGNDNGGIQTTLEDRWTYTNAWSTANENPAMLGDGSGRMGIICGSFAATQVWVVAAYDTGTTSAFGNYPTLGIVAETTRLGMGNAGQPTWYTAVAVFSSGAATNGAESATTTALPMPLSILRFDGLTLASGGWRIGHQLTPGRSWIGPICEMIFLSNATTLSNRQKLEGYLAHKWGTVGSLPNGHPYKGSAP